MSDRSKACAIGTQIRQKVVQRDRCCIFCGTSQNLQIAHYIGRGAGGLGIEENLTLACLRCHMELDQGVNSKHMRLRQKIYLQKLYPDFNESDRRYRK